MKKMKILAFAIAAAAIPAFGWEKIGVVQVTDTTGLMRAVAQVGEMTGNQALGVMAAAKLSALPCDSFFGAMRPGTSMVFPLFAEEGEDDMEIAVIYPVSLSKSQFLAMHQDAVETNGCWKVKGAPLGLESSRCETTFVRWTQDGKWAVASDSIEQVEKSMDEVENAKRPMNGALARVVIFPRGFEMLRKEMDKKLADCGDEDERKQCEIAKIAADGVSMAGLSLKVTEAGIELGGKISVVEGSELARLGEGIDCFAPASIPSGDAFYSSKTAYGRVQPEETQRVWKEICEIAETRKFPLAKFASLAAKEDGAKVVMDVKAITAWVKENEDAANEIEWDDFIEKTIAVKAGKIPVSKQSYGIGMEFKDHKMRHSAATRLAKILPETNGKSLVAAYSLSLTGMIQGFVNSAMAALEPEEAMAMAPIVALLPEETEGGIASALWKDGSNYVFLSRISAGEIKAIGTGTSALMAYFMFSNAGDDESPPDFEMDLDDDDDDADEEADEDDTSASLTEE